MYEGESVSGIQLVRDLKMCREDEGKKIEMIWTCNKKK